MPPHHTDIEFVVQSSDREITRQMRYFWRGGMDLPPLAPLSINGDWGIDICLRQMGYFFGDGGIDICLRQMGYFLAIGGMDIGLRQMGYFLAIGGMDIGLRQMG